MVAPGGALLRLKVSVCGGESGSVALLVKVRVSPALLVRLEIAASTGGRFEYTVKKNEVLAAARPSDTLTVIVATPHTLLAGMRVSVRLVPVPPKTKFVTGARFVSEDAPETVSESVAVSASETIN